MRTAVHRYRDPLDEIWLALAARVGYRVARTPDAYAHADGRGTLLVGTPETLDADDCLAQMIFHELCHALVEGEPAWSRPDWGLDNVTERDVPREHACLRVQASLARPHGLRRVLAPTTDYRVWYDALPDDPLPPGNHPVLVAARLGLARADRPPFAPHLEAALAATAEVARAAAPWADAASLVGRVEPAPPRHPTGLLLGAGGACGDCAWFDGRRCRQTRARVSRGWPGCERWEPALDCRTCAACCREAYGAVLVGPRERVVRRHPELVVAGELRRAGPRCAALAGEGPYECRVYPDRPRACREFARGGAHCLTARRRVGLSR